MLYTRGLQMFIENAIKRQVWTLAYAKQVRMLLVTSSSFMRAPLHVLAAPLPNQFPAKAAGKVVQDAPSAWGPASYVGDLDGIPDS